MDIVESFKADFKDSVSNFSGYKKFLDRSFWSACKYLYFLLFIFAFLATVKAAILLIPQIPRIDVGIANVKEVVRVGYPKDLVVDINKGQLSTNVNEPYIVDLPKNINSHVKPQEIHFIVIDTQGRVEDFSKYQTVFLLTKTALIYPDNKSLRVYPFKSDLNLRVDKNFYDNLTNKLLPSLNYAKAFIIGLFVVILIVGPFFTAAFGLLGKLIGILLWSLLFFFIAWFLKKNLRYGQVYLLSMFAVTIPTVISRFVSLIGFPLNSYEALSNMIFFLIMIYVLVKFENNEYKKSSKKA